jgi:GTPase KRas protein
MREADGWQVKDKDYFPVVVVANKCDLEYERQVQPHGNSFRVLIQVGRLTGRPEGRDLAKRFNAQCIETSAKQRVNVDEAFIAVVRAIRRYQKVCSLYYTQDRLTVVP